MTKSKQFGQEMKNLCKKEVVVVTTALMVAITALMVATIRQKIEKTVSTNFQCGSDRSAKMQHGRRDHITCFQHTLGMVATTAFSCKL